MNNNHIIEQIIAQADLVKIIGKHVELKRSGNEFKGCCPFHGEKTPSFYVNPQKGVYNCFGCGVGGNALTFLKEYENLTAAEALRELSRQTGIELPKDPIQKSHTYQRHSPPTAKTAANMTGASDDGAFGDDTMVALADDKTPSATRVITEQVDIKTLTPSSDQSSTHDIYQADNHVTGGVTDDFNLPFGDEYVDSFDGIDSRADDYLGFGDAVTTQADGSVSLYDLLEQVAVFYQQQLALHPIAMNYFSSRGLTAQTIKDFRLGYAPIGWQHLEQAFPRDIEGLKILGLVRASQKGNDYDLLRHRVIFPIRDHQGRVVGFAGRALSDEDMPKYINSSDSPVFHKQHIMYGLYEGRQVKSKDWLVVEGYMDVISLHQTGVYGAVASMGTSIATSQIDKLLQLNPVLTLSFDGDSAGQKAAWRAMEIALPVLSDGKELRFLTLPNNHDPDSFVKTYGAAAMQSQIQYAVPLSQYVFATLSRRFDITTAEGRGKLLHDVSELTKKLPKGSYGWLLREDMRARMGLGKRKQANTAQDALVNFESNLTPQLILQLCFLYQPELLGTTINGELNHQLIERILSQSGASETAFFMLKNIDPTLPDYEQILSTAMMQQSQRTAKHLADFPVQPVTWLALLDNASYELVHWIQKIAPRLEQFEQTLIEKQPYQKAGLSEYDMINAKAHYILAGLPQPLQQSLIHRWALFFMELSGRFVTDISMLVTEILTRQIMDTLQKYLKAEKNLVNKQYYNRQIQAIHRWYQAWLQRTDD